MDISNVDVTVGSNASFPDLTIIAVKGTIDAVTSKKVDEKVLPIIEKKESNVILDLSSIDYLSSTGMMCLIKYLVFLTDRKKVFKIVKPPKHVYDTLKIAGIAKHFDIYDTVEEALKTFK